MKYILIWLHQAGVSHSNRSMMHGKTALKFIQSKILRAIANAPQYVTNHTLHTEFNVPWVSDVIHERISKHHNNLEAHPNPLLESLLQPTNTRILKNAFTLTRHLRFYDRMNTLPWHSNTWYCSVLCIVIITLVYRLHSFWLLIKRNKKEFYWLKINLIISL